MQASPIIKPEKSKEFGMIFEELVSTEATYLHNCQKLIERAETALSGKIDDPTMREQIERDVEYFTQMANASEGFLGELEKIKREADPDTQARKLKGLYGGKNFQDYTQA